MLTQLTGPYVVGIDAGGTRTRCAVLTSDGTIAGTGTAAGANPNSGGDPVRSLTTALRAALRSLDPALVLEGVFGIAGAGAAGRPAAVAAARKAWENVGLRGAPTVVTDIAVAFAAGTPAPEGIVVFAGTGAGAAAISDGEIVKRSDGYGWLVGDEGSAVWLGKEAVRAALAAYDGRGSPTLLTESVPRALLGASVLMDLGLPPAVPWHQAGLSHGGQPHGSLSHGSLPHGSLSHGALSHGGLSHGSLPQGAQSHGGQPHGGQSYGAQSYGGLPPGVPQPRTPQDDTPPSGRGDDDGPERDHGGEGDHRAGHGGVATATRPATCTALRVGQAEVGQAEVGQAEVAQAIIKEVYGRPAAALGRLGPVVAATATAGDQVAQQIVREAAERLLTNVDAVRSAIKDPAAPVVMAGSVLGSGPVGDAVRAGLRQRFATDPCQAGDGAVGAAGMALRRLDG